MSPRSCTLAIAVALVGCQSQPAAQDPPKVAPIAAAPAKTEAAAAPVNPPVDPPPAVPAAPPVTTVPPLAGDGERAFVADATGLVEVALTGGAQVVAPPGVTWCSADARAQVVWFVDDRGLHSFDLVDRRTRTIAAGDFSQLEVIIDWGSEKLGGEDPLAFDVGAALRMTGVPAFTTVIGCDGDRAQYCFEEDGTTPTEELTKAKQRAAALQIGESEYVAAIAARGAKGSLAPPPPVPPKPPQKPVVARKRCEVAPKDCGSLTALPSSPLWLVVTANSRGDYYHEGRELWDPRTGEFVHVDGRAIVREKQPADTELTGDQAGLRVRNGMFSLDGVVFDDARVVFSGNSDGMAPISCGFAGGSWRIAGPTG